MKRVIWLVLLMSFLLPLSIAAQSNDVTVKIGGIPSADGERVTVPVQVRDEHGVPIAGLSAENFEIIEASIGEPRQIVDVTEQVSDEWEVSIVLALDTSGSMRGDALADAKAAALQMIAALDGSGNVALIAFADTVDFEGVDGEREVGLMRVSAESRNQFASVIDGLEADGATPLYDAALKAVSIAEDAPVGQRAILLLTDGVDEDGQGNPEQGSRRARRDTPLDDARDANIPIFTIGLGDETDEEYLRLLADQTGGFYQAAPTSEQLDTLFGNVLDMLRQTYFVTYESTSDCDGQTHRVQVNVSLDGRTESDSTTYLRPADLGCNPQAVTPVVEEEVIPVEEEDPTPEPEVIITVITEVLTVTEVISAENDTPPVDEVAQVEESVVTPMVEDGDLEEGGSPLLILLGGVGLLVALILALITWQGRTKTTRQS